MFKKTLCCVFILGFYASANSLEGPGDYIIIYPNVLAAPAAALAEYRATHDTLTPVLAKAEDIYADPRFNGPTPDVEIKNYISWAYWSWTPRPRYVVLFGYYDLLPPHITRYEIPPYYESAAYEDWFVLLSGEEKDDTPDMALGRIPVKDVAEANAYLAKVTEYEGNAGGTWNTHTLLLVDDESTPLGNPKGWKERQAKYIGDCEAILPAAFTAHKLRSSEYPGRPGVPSAEAFAALNQQLTQGRNAVLFLGTTSHECLSKFISTLPGTPNYYGNLTNYGKYPVFLNITCKSCTEEGDDNISRHLTIAPGKGAIACVGSPSATLLEEDGYFAAYLFYALFQKDPPRLGDAFLHAKTCALLGWKNWGETLRAMCLFGDPALKTDIPSNYFPELLSGWPQYFHENNHGVAIGDVTPPRCEAVPVNPPYWFVPDETQDIAAANDYDFNLWAYLGGGSIAGRGVKGQACPVFADIDGDGRPELIQIDNKALFTAQSVDIGFVFFKFFETEQFTKNAAVGDLDGDGFFEVLVPTENLEGGGGWLHVYKKDGSELAGWPKQFDWRPSSAPAVGDVNADGDLEVVITTQSDGHSALHVFDNEGDELGGWPKVFEDEVLTPASLADVDGPEDIEIVVASTEAEAGGTAGNIYVYKKNGTLHRHFHKSGAAFPLRPIVGKFLKNGQHQVIVAEKLDDTLGWFLIYNIQGDTIYGNVTVRHSTICGVPTVDDVDGDDKYELVAPLVGGFMAYNLEDDTQVEGWTGGLAGQVCSPLVADINADGETDIAVGDGKAVYVFTTHAEYKGLPNLDWPSRRHDNCNAGLYDVAQPTAVEAYDYPGDEGGKIIVRWTPSMDDGLRSRRVANYMIYRSRAGGPFEHIATHAAGEPYYVDRGLENGVTYTYYLVATDGPGDALQTNYHFSQPSARASAAPE